VVSREKKTGSAGVHHLGLAIDVMCFPSRIREWHFHQHEGVGRKESICQHHHLLPGSNRSEEVRKKMEQVMFGELWVSRTINMKKYKDYISGCSMIFYIYHNIYIYMSGWWLQSLWKIFVSWDYYSQYDGKVIKMFQSPPTSIYICDNSEQNETVGNV